MSRINNSKSTITIIAIISVIIPAAVAVLIYLPQKENFFGDWVLDIPGFNAMINTLTSLVLISALVAIKQNNIKIHRALMTTAFVLGAIFLVSYILYHLSVPNTKFGDLDKDTVLSEAEILEAGYIRYIYYFVLGSHIILSIVVVPLVLMAFYYALTEKIDKHKKVVKFTFPIWLYVSVTGVITYLMISPYY